MSLIKKIFFGLFIVLALGFAIWAYLSLKNSKKPKVDAILKLAKDKFKLSSALINDLKRAAGREVEA